MAAADARLGEERNSTKSASPRVDGAALARDYAEVKELLVELDQEHLLCHYDGLNDGERRALLDDIMHGDMRQAVRAYAAQAKSTTVTAEQMAPVADANCARADDAASADWWTSGLKAIADGQVAACLLAGGQGTRLGSPLPKATIDLAGVLRPQKSLLAAYMCQMDKLVDLAKAAYPESSPVIYVLLMTSPATRAATESHLTEVVLPMLRHIRAEHTITFDQSTLPAFDMHGKIYLQEKHQLTSSPGGNGGIYAALAPHLDKVRAWGVEYVHTFCIDNILARPADPRFVGYAIHAQADCVAKVVTKSRPDEAVGVVCLVNGVPCVVEYSELPADIAERRDAQGRLVYRAGNIANHLFTVDFLRRACDAHDTLPWHKATKKIAHVTADGTRVTPTTPNGVKAEQFIFDVFALSRRFGVYEVQREAEFAPLKNADKAGVDCPTTCVRALHHMHAEWVRAAGGTIASLNNNNEPIDEHAPTVEVDIRASYGGEGLTALCNGRTFTPPAYIR